MEIQNAKWLALVWAPTCVIACGAAPIPPNDPECSLRNIELAADEQLRVGTSGGIAGWTQESVLVDGTVREPSRVPGAAPILYPSLGATRFNALVDAVKQSGVFDVDQGCYSVGSSGGADSISSRTLLARGENDVVEFTGSNLPQAVVDAMSATSTYVNDARYGN